MHIKIVIYKLIYCILFIDYHYVVVFCLSSLNHEKYFWEKIEEQASSFSMCIAKGVRKSENIYQFSFFKNTSHGFVSKSDCDFYQASKITTKSLSIKFLRFYF